MGIEFPICVPWRSDNGGPRDDLWAFTKWQWEYNFPDCPIYAVDSDLRHKGQFKRAWACNAAVTEALRDDRWPVLVIADADTVMTDWLYVAEAVKYAQDHRALCYAHEQRYMLGPHDTAHLLSNGTFLRNPTQAYGSIDPVTTGPHPNTYSGVLAVNIELWVDVRGFDQRFVGWGFEDLAFMHACGTMGELQRAPGTCLHLWHPTKVEEREEQPHYLDNWAVWNKYTAAAGNPVAMRAVIEEAV